MDSACASLSVPGPRQFQMARANGVVGVYTSLIGSQGNGRPLDSVGAVSVLLLGVCVRGDVSGSRGGLLDVLVGWIVKVVSGLLRGCEHRTSWVTTRGCGWSV